MKLKRNNVVLPVDDMDGECVPLCELLNSLPTIQTFESCSGHLKDRFSVWFFCDSIEVLSRLGRATERNYSDDKWEVVVDSTDTHPYGVFWLRSKNSFQNYKEMNESLQSLIANIRYWFRDEFDSYFIKPDYLSVNRVKVRPDGGTVRHTIGYLEKQKEDYSSFSEEQRKYMEKYTPLDKVTLVKLLAERDMNVAAVTKSFNECFPEEKQLGNECNEHELTADAIRAWNSGYEKGYALGYANGKNAYLEDEDGAVLDKTETDTTKKDDTEEYHSEEYRERYNLSESKKNEIVSGKFLYALTNFSLFKKWEAYWLEYVGDDTYIGRSDNILNEKVVITPYQLDNYFSEIVPSGFEKRLTEWFYGMRTWGLTADEETCENFCDSQAHKAVKDLWACIEKTPTKSD